MNQIDGGGVTVLKRTCLRTLRLAIKMGLFLGLLPRESRSERGMMTISALLGVKGYLLSGYLGTRKGLWGHLYRSVW